MSFTIFPAIDLRAGKVVRLKEGDPKRVTRYSEEPAAMAQYWLSLGARWLHVVNLDGAFREDDAANQAAIRGISEVVKASGAHIQFGGGLRSVEDIQQALEWGIHRVVLGTIAVEHPEVVAQSLQYFGADRIAVGIDARDEIVRKLGWKEDGGISAIDLGLQMRKLGVRTLIVTDISRDGLGTGLNVSFTRQLTEASGLDVIASGGVHTIEDVYRAQEANLTGVIIGRALYEGTIDFNEALKFERS